MNAKISPSHFFMPLLIAWATMIRFAHPIGKPGLVLLDDFDAAIGGAAVDDDVFQVRVALEQHRADSFLDVLCLVIEGVTILIFGQEEPSGMLAGSGELASVHGQPVLPSGESGRL